MLKIILKIQVAVHESNYEPRSSITVLRRKKYNAIFNIQNQLV